MSNPIMSVVCGAPDKNSPRGELVFSRPRFADIPGLVTFSDARTKTGKEKLFHKGELEETEGTYPLPLSPNISAIDTRFGSDPDPRFSLTQPPATSFLENQSPSQNYPQSSDTKLKDAIERHQVLAAKSNGLQQEVQRSHFSQPLFIGGRVESSARFDVGKTRRALKTLFPEHGDEIEARDVQKLAEAGYYAPFLLENPKRSTLKEAGISAALVDFLMNRATVRKLHKELQGLRVQNATKREQLTSRVPVDYSSFELVDNEGDN